MNHSIRIVSRRNCVILTTLLLLSGAGGRTSIAADKLRLNQIQVIGTHNSYHIAPTTAMMQLIASADRESAPKLDYSHRPLEEQFGVLGIRQIELDLFADPEGGRFATPMAYKVITSIGGDAGPDPDSDGSLKTPGFKILHVPDIDYRTTVTTLKEAIQRIRTWSLNNPSHIPLFVLIELKDEPIKGLIQPVKFTPELLDQVDAAIRAGFESKNLITPDQVRKSRETLREAILEDGWPSLDQCRGRVLFALDNEGSHRDDYLDGHPSLKGRMMFVSASSPTASEAAFFKINDPIQNHAQIQELVQQGFLVRTRADADTLEARKNDTRRRDQAFSSGAQMISTDYPIRDPRLTEYEVRFPNARMIRSNPVTCLETIEISDVAVKE
jgi:hypothetical protein